MRFWLRCCFLLVVSVSGFAQSLDANSNYWQCSTRDSLNRVWIAKNMYEKIALNVSFSACKKDSQVPATCKSSNSNCEQFVLGASISPMWRCTALDRKAMPWFSNIYAQRDDAALAARAYCREKSSVPETCYINLITCSDRNELRN